MRWMLYGTFCTRMILTKSFTCVLLFKMTCLFISVSDPHWFHCGSGSSFLPQCGSGSREPNQCGPRGSQSRSWSHFVVTKSQIFTWKIYSMLVNCYGRTYVSKSHLKKALISFLLDPDRVLSQYGSDRIQETRINADPEPDPKHCYLFLKPILCLFLSYFWKQELLLAVCHSFCIYFYFYTIDTSIHHSFIP